MLMKLYVNDGITVLSLASKVAAVSNVRIKVATQ